MFACVGSNPTVNKVKNINTSDVAQRLACLAHNQKVGGSNPLVAIMFPHSKKYHALLAGKIGSIPFAPSLLY